MSNYFTLFAIRSKYSVFNGTKRRIFQLPYSISRDCSFCTYKVSTNCSKFYYTIRSIVVIFGRNICTYKFTSSRSRRNKQNTCCSFTLCTVRWRIVNLQFFTWTLRQICGGTATVTVNRIGTAQIQHYFCQFIHRHPCRIRCLTTIIQHDNYCTIWFNPNNRARCRITMIWLRLIYTVFYNIPTRCRNNLFFPAIEVGRGANLRHFYFRNISRSRISIFIKIFIDYNNRRETNIAILIAAVRRVKQNLCIQHNKAQRLTNTIRRVVGIPA